MGGSRWERHNGGFDERAHISAEHDCDDGCWEYGCEHTHTKAEMKLEARDLSEEAFQIQNAVMTCMGIGGVLVTVAGYYIFNSLRALWPF